MLPGKQVVGFTQPQDSAKLDALAKKHGVQTRTIGDWTAIAKTSATLDTVANATTHLADNDALHRCDERGCPTARSCARTRTAHEARTAARGDPGRDADDDCADRRRTTGKRRTRQVDALGRRRRRRSAWLAAA